MNPFIANTVPLIVAFFIGVAVKHLKLMSKEDAPILLKFVLTVCLPALSILAIYRVEFKANLLLIPILAMSVVFIMYGIGHLIQRWLKLPRQMFGTFLIGIMIMNSAYALPFFERLYGYEGLARASLFDFGNSFLIFTFSYYNAIKYGGKADKDKIEWKKFLKLPPLYAMVAAFIIKFGGVVLPEGVQNFLAFAGSPTTLLVMVALGLYFEPMIQNLTKAFLAIFIRMGLGLGIGYALSMLFGLKGLDAMTITVGASLPIGFNTLLFADMEDLDRGFAATMVSFSIIIALFYLPLMMYVFKP